MGVAQWVRVLLSQGRSMGSNPVIPRCRGGVVQCQHRINTDTERQVKLLTASTFAGLERSTLFPVFLKNLI